MALIPIEKGWIAQRPKGTPVAFTPTPELVHGVIVDDPELARVLRKAGWFSGKKIRTHVTDAVSVQRDEYGFVLSANRAES